MDDYKVQTIIRIPIKQPVDTVEGQSFLFVAQNEINFAGDFGSNYKQKSFSSAVCFWANCLT